jgi:hypothetical protein
MFVSFGATVWVGWPRLSPKKGPLTQGDGLRMRGCVAGGN